MAYDQDGHTWPNALNPIQTVIDKDELQCFIEPEQAQGMDRRVFRYEHGLVGAYLEYAYYADFMNWMEGRSNRARWYGYVNKTLPDTFKAREG